MIKSTSLLPGNVVGLTFTYMKALGTSLTAGHGGWQDSQRTTDALQCNTSSPGLWTMLSRQVPCLIPAAACPIMHQYKFKELLTTSTRCAR